jgi:hypothetical protein
MKIKIANQQNRICYEYNSYYKSWKKIYPRKRPRKPLPAHMKGWKETEICADCRDWNEYGDCDNCDKELWK